MAEESILTDELVRQLISVGESDILVGVPTYNNADTIGPVVQTIRAGLLKYFPRERAVIINADGGSRDDTQNLVTAASIDDRRHAYDMPALRTLHCISARYPGNPATGKALHTILAAADLLRSAACAIVSPDSTGITPDWIEKLLRPAYREGYDLVTPLYSRHKFEGLLLRILVYPMTRALYGKQLREPHAPEFAFSGRLCSQFLEQDIWASDVGQTGAEICLSIAAMADGSRIGQSFLGSRAQQDGRPPDLVAALRQTVGGLLWSLEKNFPKWSANSGSQPVPVLAAGPEITAEPLRVNRKRLHQMFCQGVVDLDAVLKTVLRPETLTELQEAARQPENDFRYSDDLWVRTMYDIAVSHHRSVINRDHIVQTLAPLYRGKAYTFLVENRDASAHDVEAAIENLCLAFERLKPYLLEHWEEGK